MSNRAQNNRASHRSHDATTPRARTRKSESAAALEQTGRAEAAKVGESFEDIGRHARDYAEQKIETLRDTATGYLQQGRDTAKQLEQRVENRIVEKPLQSLLLAAVIGFILGLFYRR